MTKQRYIAAILAALMLASTTACNSGTESETRADTKTETTGTETVTESETETETETEETTFSTALEKKNYNGADFRIYTSNTINGMENVIFMNHAEEQTGEIINDTLFNRDIFVEDSFNVKLQYTVDDERGSYEVSQNASKNILAGDDSTELFIHDQGEMAKNLSIQGCIYPLNLVPGLKLQETYWYPEINKTSYIGEDLYFGSCMISPRYYGSVYLTVFNRDRAEELQLEDIYALVSDGKWTIDKMFELSRLAVNDTDGDGKVSYTDNLGYFWDSHEALINGCGFQLVKNVDGHLVASLDDERMVNLFQKMVSFFDEEGEVYAGEDGVDYDAILKNGNALFYNPCASDLVTFRDFEYDFGILPMPKYDEAQSGYIAFSQPWINATAMIPVTVTGDTLEMAGTLTNAMVAYGYDYLRPAVFENVLMLKTTRDEQSAQIIELIFENVVFELSTTLRFDSFYQSIRTFFNEKRGQQDITSLYASVKPALEASIKSTEEKYAEIGANFDR